MRPKVHTTFNIVISARADLSSSFAASRARNASLNSISCAECTRFGAADKEEDGDGNGGSAIEEILDCRLEVAALVDAEVEDTVE